MDLLNQYPYEMCAATIVESYIDTFYLLSIGYTVNDTYKISLLLPLHDIEVVSKYRG